MAQAKTSSPEPFGNRKLPRVMLQFITDGTQGKSKKINDFEFSKDEMGLNNRLMSFEYTLVNTDASDTSLKYKLTVRNPDDKFASFTRHLYIKPFRQSKGRVLAL